LETSAGYQLNQKLANPTVRLFKGLIQIAFSDAKTKEILDIGCGTGNYRPCFPGHYTGLDINPAYVASASERYPDARFAVMNAANLNLESNSFDEVVSIATTHHLTDAELVSMTGEALRVARAGGHFHIFDAILPVERNRFKTTFFRLDRGRFPREAGDLLKLVGQCGTVTHKEILGGLLHDVIYVRIRRND
jgi:ubiquinone/menaquinone biosynthesis C-methylase UbiE